MSPLVWDLAHIGQQEELWLLRGGNPDRPGMLPPEVDGLYDAFVNSRASRVDLPLLPPSDARAYLRTVRDKALDALDALPDDDPDGSVVQLRAGDQPREPARRNDAAGAEPAVGAAAAGLRARLPPGRPGVAGTSVLVPGGPFVLGVDAVTEPYSLDNERPAHVVDVPGFRIGRVPVTNGEWRQFIDDGGYRQPRWWSERGWAHREQAGLTAPQFWNRGRHPHPVRSRRGHSRRRARPARHVLRGRGVRGLGRCPAAHRDRMGEGVRLGPESR